MLFEFFFGLFDIELKYKFVIENNSVLCKWNSF